MQNNAKEQLKSGNWEALQLESLTTSLRT